MWWGRKKRHEGVTAFLGAGAEFEGKLVLSGAVRIDGIFKGEIKGSGTLIVGESARVESSLSVDAVVVYGEVRGTLDIRERLEIGAPGRVFGTIATPVLMVEKGGLFEGECRMSEKRKKTPGK